MKGVVVAAEGSPPQLGDFDEPTAGAAAERSAADRAAGDGVVVDHAGGDGVGVDRVAGDHAAAGGRAASIDVLAAGINPSDRMRIGEGPFPRVIGNEGVGRLPSGERVYFERTIAPFGSFAERALIDAECSIPLPDAVADGAALTIGIAGLAAWMALTWRGRLEPGERVLVLGAAGAVGQVAVQAAKLLGAGLVVAATRQPAEAERLLERGADRLVALDDDAARSLRGAAAGDGFDLVVDPIFGAPLEAALTATAPGARIVNVGRAAGERATLSQALLMGRSLLTYGNRAAPAEAKRAAYLEMLEHVAAGRLSADFELMPLADFDEAWRRQAAHPRRKLVLVAG